MLRFKSHKATAKWTLATWAHIIDILPLTHTYDFHMRSLIIALQVLFDLRYHLSQQLSVLLFALSNLRSRLSSHYVILNKLFHLVSISSLVLWEFHIQYNPTGRHKMELQYLIVVINSNFTWNFFVFLFLTIYCI